MASIWLKVGSEGRVDLRNGQNEDTHREAATSMTVTPASGILEMVVLEAVGVEVEVEVEPRPLGPGF